MPTDSPTDRYLLISSDCHAGADIADYKPYLERRWHDEFDAWATTYSDSWADIDADSVWKAGVSSFMSPLNWDSNKRLEALEAEGIVAEVLFPNTTPPFFPNGLLAAPGPRDRDEYERRWAGIKAHNRWLKDFCDEAPGRRFGVAQLFIDNVDDAVAEIRWAKEAGMRQVLLPSDHHLKLHNLYYASLDPIWSVCEELDMPIGRHGSVVGSDVEAESVDAAHAVGVLETTYFGQRSLGQLILSGVFERHPNLKFVFTELGAGMWYETAIAGLDRFYKGANMDGTIVNMFAGKATAKLPLLPSEYANRQVYFGAAAPPDVLEIHRALGLDKLMWGADFPHHEGTAPYTTKVLRGTLSSVPHDEIRQILSGSAAAVYGADVEQLQRIADEVGPTVEEIETPLQPDEIPADLNFLPLINAGQSLSTLNQQR
jgi:predicted TIM-barrel fold metal-dependent hydrolase